MARGWVFVAVAILGAGAACGNGGAAIDAPVPPGDDAPPVIDAPAGAPDAKVRPVAACEHKPGTHLVLRRAVPDRMPHQAATLLTSPPFDARQFLTYRDGLILISEDGVVRPTPFLDIGPLVAGIEHEQGLLGLAFHPSYAENRTFYIFYATVDTNVLARYRVSDDPYVADPTSGEILISVPDLHPNHNGGMLNFGADGYLYISTGDGGGGSDAEDNAENTDRLYGKILRIDVDHPGRGTTLYAIPPDNPFVAGGGAPEVYAYGFRNPWRWSFDTTGEMYIGDVGEHTWEEVNIIDVAAAKGANFGWDPIEGTRCNEPRTSCTTDGTVLPTVEFAHDDGFCAVLGGAVYRGDCYPDLVGTYVFSDYCKREIWTLKAEGGVVTTPAAASIDAVPPAGSSFTALYQDATGELFVVDNYGGAYHIEADGQ
jgi:glucose/arabinose dehydrogenase